MTLRLNEYGRHETGFQVSVNGQKVGGEIGFLSPDSEFFSYAKSMGIDGPLRRMELVGEFLTGFSQFHHIGDLDFGRCQIIILGG